LPLSINPRVKAPRPLESSAKESCCHEEKRDADLRGDGEQDAAERKQEESKEKGEWQRHSLND
jgi:hypothetical protein